MAVWPCNQAAMGFFIDYCTTQWRVGAAGPTGLDRGVVLQDLRRLRLPQDDEDALYAQVREIERVALRKMHQLSEQGRDR